jgi:multidrug resistance efflux pump
MNAIAKAALTGAIVLVAIGIVTYKYWDYVTNPWTRDGQVRAQVIQITPRVSGPIVKLPIADNQLVAAGELLFEIDPRTFQASLDQARADLDQTRDDLKSLAEQVNATKAEVAQYDALIQQGESVVKERDAQLADASATFQRVQDAGQAVSALQVDNARASYNVALASKEEAQGKLLEAKAQRLEAEAQQAQAEAELGASGDENAQLRAAKAAVESAELDLEFTQVKASVDGYVTNLALRLGSQAVENEPALALVDCPSSGYLGQIAA